MDFLLTIFCNFDDTTSGGKINYYLQLNDFIMKTRKQENKKFYPNHLWAFPAGNFR